MRSKDFTVTENDDIGRNEEETVMILNAPKGARSYFKVWTMSPDDALHLYHQLGDYLVAQGVNRG